MGYLTTNAQTYYGNSSAFGEYQFVSLNDIIEYFMFVYVGEDKIISKASRTDVAFHAQRGLAELSFDTFKSCKSKEIEVPASLQMVLPQDYVNYTKISWVDSAGIKHPLYPTNRTSNPERYQADTDGEYLFHSGNLIPSGELIKNGNFHGNSSNWTLNQTYLDDGTVESSGSSSQPVSTSTAAATLGDPAQGWFYEKNAIRAYDIVDTQGVTQAGTPIISGESYKVTYTLSGYTAGAFRLSIIDENGDITSMTDATADGTYSETLVASGTSASYSSNSVMLQNIGSTNGNFTVDGISIVRVGDEESSDTWSNYKSATPSENNNDDYEDDTYWPLDGNRYGLDPQHAQVNGSFYIDCKSGKIHFSSNISGKTVILDYISDSLGTDAEMKVHKFAEQAMYAWISHAILAGKSNIPEYQVNRFKKERFAAVRTAKLRLSNIKLEEITQILRGKSKQIKH
jgi:hypothetical protein